MAKRIALGPADWVIAALAALSERGVDAVSVEALAKRLGTSKGSFYWHFADRNALLEAVLLLWEQEGTADLIQRASAVAEPAERLRVLAKDALEAQSRGVDVALTEAAIRGWAARDPKVGQRFARIEQDRTTFVTVLVSMLGYDTETALHLGKVIHLTLIGLYVSRASGSSLAEDQTFATLVERIIAGAPKQ